MRVERVSGKLPGGAEAADDFANLGARGEWREKDLRLLAGGCNGGLQIAGQQHGQRGDLRGSFACHHCTFKAGLQGFPGGGLAVGAGEQDDAEACPQIVQSAEDGGFGELLAERFAKLDRGLNTGAFDGLPDFENQGRDASRAGGGGIVLPTAIAAQGEDVGEVLGGNEEVGLLSGHAQQIQCKDVAFVGEACEQGGRVLNCLEGRGGVGLAKKCLYKRGCRRGKLHFAGQEEAQAGLLQPFAGGVKGEESLAVLVPSLGTCLLELLSIQRSSFFARAGVRSAGESISENGREITLNPAFFLILLHDESLTSPAEEEEDGRCSSREMLHSGRSDPLKGALDVLPSIP